MASQKIVCSPPDSVRPATLSASPSSTILFWATIASTALRIRAGRGEAHNRGFFVSHRQIDLTITSSQFTYY